MTEDAFVRAILTDPADDALRLVYADWLEEGGETDRSAYLRLLCQLSGPAAPVGDQLPPLLARLDALRAELDQAWVGLMHRGRTLADLTPPIPTYREGRIAPARQRRPRPASGRRASVRMSFFDLLVQ